jgi:GNAT superfamily N-acetyltransferase
MQVRPARVDDAAAIADAHTRAWQAAYEHVFGAENLATIDSERRRRWWERCVREGLETVLVAEKDGRVVAFASLGPAREDAARDDAAREDAARGELYAIYALPEAWGSGAGPALLEAGVEALREGGYREAILWVLDDNPRARRFYEREGWTPDGGTKTDAFFGVRVTEVRYRLLIRG